MDQSKIHEAVHRFIRLDRMHRRAIEREVGEMGLHRSQHRLLMTLSHGEEMPSQAELARRLDISPPAVAGALGRLEKGGYILRTEDKEDGRNHKVRLTEKGESILKSTRQRFDSVDRTMFEGIGEQELKMFCDLVDRMGQNLAEKEKTHETMV